VNYPATALDGQFFEVDPPVFLEFIEHVAQDLVVRQALKVRGQFGQLYIFRKAAYRPSLRFCLAG